MALRAILLPLALSFALAGCVPAAETPASSAPTAAPVAITDRTARELSDVLAAQSAAVRSKDLSGFQRTIDGTRLAFRRCEAQFFDTATRLGGTTLIPGRVLSVDAYHDTYARAYVGDDALGYAPVYFRRDDAGHWIVTEPLTDELGGEQQRTIDGLAIEFWGVDDAVVDAYAASAVKARNAAAAVAPRPATTAWSLRILPTRETVGLSSVCGASADSSFRNDRIRIFPGAVRVDRSLRKVTAESDALFRHEALHQVQFAFIPRITSRLDWWLIEGWPDFIAQSRSVAAIRANVCAPAIPTFKQLVDGPRLEADTPPEIQFQYYSYANTMVGYLYEMYGKNAYWDLVALFQDEVDPKINYPKALKATPDAFYTGWLTWARKQYC